MGLSTFAPKQSGGPQLSVFPAAAMQPQQPQQRSPARNPFLSQPVQQQGLQQVHSQQLQRQQLMQHEAASGMQRAQSPARFNPAMHTAAGVLSQPTRSQVPAAMSPRAPLSYAGFDAEAGRSSARAQQMFGRPQYAAAAATSSMPFSLSQQAQPTRSQSAMQVRTQDDCVWRGQQRQPYAQARFVPQLSLSQQPMQQSQLSPSISGQKHRLSDSSLAAQDEAKVQRMAAAGGMRVSVTQREAQPTTAVAEPKNTDEEKVQAAPTSIGAVQVVPAIGEATVPAPAQESSMEEATLSAPAMAEEQSQPAVASSSIDTQDAQAASVAPSLQDANEMARMTSEDPGVIVADSGSQEPESFVLVQHSPKHDAAEAPADSIAPEATDQGASASVVVPDDGDSVMAAGGLESEGNAVPQVDSQPDQVPEQSSSLQSVPDSSMALPQDERENDFPQQPTVDESVIEVAPAEGAVTVAVSDSAGVMDGMAANQRIEPPIVQEEAVVADTVEVQPPIAAAAAAAAPQFAVQSQKKGLSQSLPMPESDETEEEANQQMDEEKKDEPSEIECSAARSSCLQLCA